MFFSLIFSLCCVTAWALPQYQPQYYSFSPTVGRGHGESFASVGEGRITGVRIWEQSNSYIKGFQLKYENVWTPIYGSTSNEETELLLFEGEAIVQISGKYNPPNYIYCLRFVTSRGRSLIAGQPTGNSFNFYPVDGQSELQIVSGRSDGTGIASIGAHWALIYRNDSKALT
ncbi:hypothetical protein AAFF_G00402990 [Aldrovandia affinis]|uniref:Jacalin-type lectin domain-containing protein n=1 Tax=Aldrovandia affinis TaxID=143900 RepID=A0AAD7T7G4_9TELE|nr:hypothetical protein AAFF_G00402990 [Aldrovandia affinis]